MTTTQPLSAQELKEMKERAAQPTEPKCIVLPEKFEPGALNGIQQLAQQSEQRRKDLERCIEEIERLQTLDEQGKRIDSEGREWRKVWMRVPCQHEMEDLDDTTGRCKKCGDLIPKSQPRPWYTKDEIDSRLQSIIDLLELIPKWAEEDDGRVTKHQDLARKAMKLSERAWRKALLDFLEAAHHPAQIKAIDELRDRFLPPL